MAVFKYKALDKDGKKRAGLIKAVSEDSAAETLREKNFSVISIKELAGAKRGGITILNRISVKDLVIFSRQFAVIISANVSMVQALNILIDQTENVRLKMIISEIADEVDSGSRLSGALAKRSKVFSGFFVSVIKSGETSGKLNEVLNYLADEMEKDHDMMSKIRGAMIYPAFILFSLGIVGVIMMVYVVPKLTGILTETGADLPIATKILIGTSGFISCYWWLILIILAGLAVGFRFYISKPWGRKQFDFLILRVPIFGRLFQLIYLVRFTRSMNTLIASGITITDSLKIASEVVSNKAYQQLINKTVKEVEDGNSISSIFIKSKEVPKMVSQMMSIGEKTGKLDIIFERITSFYSREITNIVANLMTIMEPFVMIIMGIAVGIMVAAIILPMYNLASQF
ncbi:MAG: type II secretion system F family protein [Patescibacteria group bacterium]|nr:type II secretion system F family protein [Patescibacteria group bacterium]